MVHRERAAEFQKFAFLGRVIGTVFGMDEVRLARAEDLLSATIFQTLHDPHSMRAKVQQFYERAQSEKSARMRDAALLQRTASYSEDDEEATDKQFTQTVFKQHNPRSTRRS